MTRGVGAGVPEDVKASLQKALDNIDKIQRLVNEFEPELKALGEKTDDLADRVEAIEKSLADLGVEVGPRATTLHANVLVRHGLLSNIDSTTKPDADPDELETDYDDFGIGSFQVIVDHQAKDYSARLSYWEDTNANPFHGRAANKHGIDEAWISTTGLGGKWTVGNQYPGGYNATLMGGAVDPMGLLAYTPTAELGIQYETDLGGLDLVGFLGSTGGDDKYDGLGVVRASIDLGHDLTLGGTYLATGSEEQQGWSADLGLKVLNRKVMAEYCELTQAANGTSVDDDNTAWIVSVPALVESGSLSIGASYGEVEVNFAPTALSVINNPYLLDPAEDPFDRPLFLNPANVAEGWEVTAKLSLGNTPIQVRYYDGDDINGNDAKAVTTIGLAQKLSKVATLELLYGMQEDGAGQNADLSLARAQVKLGF